MASHVGTTLNARSISLDELVGALGVELLSPLQTRKLFIPRSDKTDKNGRNAQPRYTQVHRGQQGILIRTYSKRGLPIRQEERGSSGDFLTPKPRTKRWGEWLAWLQH